MEFHNFGEFPTKFLFPKNREYATKCPDTNLFGRLNGFLEELEKSIGKIIQFEFGVLDVPPEVNVLQNTTLQKEIRG